MRAMVLSATVFVTVMSITPSRLTVASNTCAPTSFETGMDSPVTLASSMPPRPAVITPSVGTRAPGRRTTTSPTASSPAATSSTAPPAVLRGAVSGRSAISASMARRARPSARSSSVFEMLNSVSSTAPSNGAPTTAAAMAAAIIRRSMSRTCSRHSSETARQAVGNPPAR